MLQSEREAAETSLDEMKTRLEDLLEAAREREAEGDQLKQELEQSKAEQLQLQDRCEKLQASSELERLRAMEVERRRWEAREERLFQQIASLEAAQERRLSDGGAQLRGSLSEREWGNSDADCGHSSSERTGESRVSFTAGHREELERPNSNSVTASDPATEQLHLLGIAEQLHPPSVSMLGAGVAAPTYLAQQLPSLAPFKGEIGTDSEGIEQWLERFDMLAEECRWTDRAKLLHLVARLEKQAYAFYRSCPSQKKASYDSLVVELRKRFTPVRIQGVDTSLFHERRQAREESVDQYAQELRRLYHKAYPESLRGSEDAECIGKTLLASQLVAGLKPEIKKSVAGCEQSGDLEQLLTRARFEEAKIREIWGSEPKLPHGSSGGQNRQLPPQPHSGKGIMPTGLKPNTRGSSGRNGGKFPSTPHRSSMTCFNCGGVSHFARECKWHDKRRDVEARGRAPHLSAIVVEHGAGNGKEHKPPRSEIEEVLATTTLHGLTPEGDEKSELVGPLIKTEVALNGFPVKALIDTGSPITLVSIECLIQAMWETKPQDQSEEDWKEEFLAKVKPSKIILKGCGGRRLNMAGQVEVTLRRGEYCISTTVQVYRKSTEPMILGTDIQTKLGFGLVECTQDGRSIEILSGQPVFVTPRLEEDELSPSPSPIEPLKAPAMVHLVQAARIPAQHTCLVQTRISGSLPSEQAYQETWQGRA